MKRAKRAIIHGGKAHADEFLALGFGLAYGVIDSSTPVFRRDPTEAELDDPNVLVLDVGGRHEPENNNFDHHQRGQDEDPECAFTLFLQHLDEEAHQLLLETTHWYKMTRDLDVLGPFKVAAKYDMHPNAVFGLAGSIHTPIVKMLEMYQDERVLGHVLATAQAVGLSHRRFANDIGLDLAMVKDNVRIEKLHGVPYLLFLDTFDYKSPLFMTAINMYRDRVQDPQNQIAFVILRDDRGGGMMLYRFNDDPRVDFSVLNGMDEKDKENLVFAHNGGFIAKTATRDLGTAVEFAEISLVKNP